MLLSLPVYLLDIQRDDIFTILARDYIKEILLSQLFHYMICFLARAHRCRAQLGAFFSDTWSSLEDCGCEVLIIIVNYTVVGA